MTEQDYTQVRTLEGCFFTDKRDEVIGAVIGTDRVWEFWETEWIKSIVAQGDYVIDAGANIGWYTVVMARLVGSRGHVFAFEPEPTNFALLKKNVEWNSYSERCSLFQHALWEEPTNLPLVLSSYNLGDHALRPTAGKQISHRGSEATEILVPCRTLDSVLFESTPSGGAPLLPADAKIRVIKVDTQGSEVSIFKGAKRTLEATQYLLTEFSPNSLTNLGTTKEALVAILKENFDEFTRVEKKQREFQPISEIEKDMLRPARHWNGEFYLALRKKNR
jgi:methyltransferase, FkbM family